MSNIPTRLTPKHYIKPHSMGLEKKSRFLSPGVYVREGDTMTIPVAYEPMMIYRYIMDIHDHNRGVQSFFVRINREGRPTSNLIHEGFPAGYGTHHTHSGYFRQQWQPLEIKLVDPIGENSSVDYFRDWMVEGFNPNDGRIGLARDYKKHIELSKLDPVGSVIEKWALDGAQIQSLNHEIVYDETRGDIEMRIIYDNAHIIY